MYCATMTTFVNVVLFNVATRMEKESVNTLKGNVLNNMLKPSEKGLKAILVSFYQVIDYKVPPTVKIRSKRKVLPTSDL